MVLSELPRVMTCPAPPVDRREILRYAGMRGTDEAVESLLDSCLAEALPQLGYRLLFRCLPVTAADEGVCLGGACFPSARLAARLAGCSRAVLFAATVGLGMDRLTRRWQAADPPRALLLHAIGAERVEALCDAFCAALAAEHTVTSRFSPGYGDLAIDTQRTVFRLLDGSRIGLSLGESLLMTPTKSVTAFVGIKDV